VTTSPGSLAVWVADARRLARRIRRRLRGTGARRTIVTGSSSSHASCLLNLLHALELSHVAAELVVYDLGLTPDERARVAACRGVEVRSFPFDAYPPHLDISVAAGEYAWKPIIVSDVARERSGLVLWMDAGDFVFDDLEWIWTTIAVEGIYTPTSSGTVRRWTHPATLAALDAPNSLLTLRNRAAALVGFDTRRPEMLDVLERWRSAAIDPDVIAPPGSDRSNHRQDQAVLTVLYYQARERLGFRPIARRDGVMLHFDSLPAEAVPAAVAALRAHPELRRVRWGPALPGHRYP
jgi:hypothetical protein